MDKSLTELVKETDFEKEFYDELVKEIIDPYGDQTGKMLYELSNSWEPIEIKEMKERIANLVGQEKIREYAEKQMKRNNENVQLGDYDVINYGLAFMIDEGNEKLFYEAMKGIDLEEEKEFLRKLDVELEFSELKDNYISAIEEIEKVYKEDKIPLEDKMEYYQRIEIDPKTIQPKGSKEIDLFLTLTFAFMRKTGIETPLSILEYLAAKTEERFS